MSAYLEEVWAYLEQVLSHPQELSAYLEGVSARPEPGLAWAMPVGWVRALVTCADALAAGVGVLAATALVGAGELGEPLPHASASSDQVIANTIRAQRS